MRTTLILAAVLSAALFALPVKAQPQCNTHDEVQSQLAKKYNEHPISAGVTHNGGLIEVYATEDGATWSIVISGPNGVSCLVSSGEGWRALPAQLGQAL